MHKFIRGDIMTKEEFKATLLKVSEILGDNEAGLEHLKALQDGFNSLVDSHPPETPVIPVEPEKPSEWEQKYNDILRRYHERFFGDEDSPIEPPPSPILPTPPEENYSYDTILKEV